MTSFPLYLQLHSLRREAAVDAERVIREVAAMGFDGVEMVRDYGWSADQWRRLLNDTGLTLVAAHSDLEALETDLPSKVSFHRALANHRLIATALPRAPQTPERYRAGARRLNAVGQRLLDEGFTFVFHNHSYEFEPLQPGSDSCGMKVLLAETDPKLVRFEFDTFWLEFTGRNAVEFIQRHADRVEMIHAKDLRKLDRQDVPAGQGDVDFRRLAPLCAERGWPVVLEYEGLGAPAAVQQGGSYLRSLFP